AAAPGPSGLVRRELHAADRGRFRGRPRRGIRPWRPRDHDGDPPAGRPAQPWRLGRYRASHPHRASDPRQGVGGCAYRFQVLRAAGAAFRTDVAVAGRVACPGGIVTFFSVWAPAANRVEVEAAGRVHPLLPGDRPGWWQAEVDAGSGTDYAFRLDGG